MKTIALTLAATLIASTSALANGGILFDVNQAPHNFAVKQQLDKEATASIGSIERNIFVESNGARFQKDRNPALFDVDD